MNCLGCLLLVNMCRNKLGADVHRAKTSGS